VEVLSERLGHASVSITLDTYRHLYEVERKAAALSLNDLMMPRGALN
jgi:integrase